MTRPSREELRGLYSAPFHDFVQRRTELARSLRRAGLRGEASRVQKLTKPTFSAWLANYLYWHQEPLFRDLLKAGEQLRRKQQAIRAGRGLSVLRKPRQAVQDAIRPLMASARQETSRLGKPWTTRTERRILRTLETVAQVPQESFNPPLGELVEDLKPGGFDALLCLLPGPPASDSRVVQEKEQSSGERGSGGRKASRRDRRTRLQTGGGGRDGRARERERARSVRDRARGALNESRSSLEGLERRRDACRQEKDSLLHRLDALTGQLSQIERRLARARAGHQRKAAALEKAERALEKLGEADD